MTSWTDKIITLLFNLMYKKDRLIMIQYREQAMKDKKILPVKYPSITCHQSFASLLSILECIPDTKEWIYSNFIITEAFSYISGYGEGSVELVINPAYDFSIFCPWFWKSELSHETISSFEPDIINFIIKCIDTDNYMLLFVDESKLNCIDSEMPLFHDIFIYGYDYERKFFYVADFTFNHGKYKYETVSFSEISEAYSSAVSAGKNLNNEGAAKLWHVKSDAHYSLDVTLIRDELQEYLKGYSYSNRFTRVYWQAPLNKSGIDVYPFLCENLDKSGMRKCLHNLYDHKQLMLERLGYLVNKGYISDKDKIQEKYSILVKDTQIAVNLYIKYSITGKIELLEKIKFILESIMEEEVRFFKHLLIVLS